MDRRSCVPSAAALLANASIQCTIVLLATLRNSPPEPYYPMMLLPYAMVLFAADRIFLRQERTVMALVLLNGGMCLFSFLSILLFGGVCDLGSVIMALVFCLWLAARAGQMSLKQPALSELILTVDLCLIILALFTAYLSAVELPISWCVPIAVGCAASILGVIVFRSGANPGPQSWTFLTGVFAGIFAMVWLLVSFVAAPAGEGLLILWQWLLAVVTFCLKLLWRIVFFLLSLFPTGEGGEMWTPAESQVPQQVEEEFQSNPLIAAIVLAVFGICIIAACVFLLRYLYRLRLPAIRSKAGATVLRRRVSLFSGLHRLLASWRSWVRRRIWIWKNRNTAKGLYFLLVVRSGPTPWHKLRGETPREFLSRLEHQAAEDQELTGALQLLIPAVERALFSRDGQDASVPQAQLIRRKLNSAVRKGLLKEGWSNLVRRFKGNQAGQAGPPDVQKDQ